MQNENEAIETLFANASRLHAANRFDETCMVLERLLSRHPTHAAALNLMGIALGQQGDLAGGCLYVERAIEVEPDHAIYLRNLCELRRQNDDPFGAVAMGRRAVAVAPNDRIALLNLAMAEQDALQLDEAAANTAAVLAAEPENGSAHFLAAQLALMRGDFVTGWREYDWRWQIPGAEKPRPSTDVPEWAGTPLGGTLLLIADQGFGDIMQFARYLPWAAARCRNLVVCVPRELRGLLSRLEPRAHYIIDLVQAAEFAAYAVFSSLPGLAGTTLSTVPSAKSYLSTEPIRVERWTRRLEQLAPPPNRRIGLVWAGRREHRADRQRSMALSLFHPLFSLPGITFVSLQKGEPVSQIGSYFGPAPLVNIGPELEDFDDTAAVLSGLEALITVDTSVAHLAGGLGVPTHVLLPFRPDWRWLLERSDTPWYDSIRLWRDSGPGQRGNTVRQLACAFDNTPAIAAA